MTFNKFAPIFFLGLSLAQAVFAHDLPQSYLDCKAHRLGLDAKLTAHVFEITDALHTQNIQNDSLQNLLRQQFEVVADGKKLTLVLDRIAQATEIQSLVLYIHFPWEKIPGTIQIHSNLFSYNPRHETHVTITESDNTEVYQEILNKSHQTFDYYTGSKQGIYAVIKKFVAAGIHHIFIGPDHILFIIALLFAGGGWKKLVMIVTSFTLAHTMTLSLATFNVIQPPSAIIEPLIALTVMGAGLRNLLVQQKRRDFRTPIAFGFGLIHGFGFASVLQEFGLPRQVLGWSLFSFNAGVEIGQLCIVLAVVPFLTILGKHYPLLSQKLVRYGSMAVVAMGGYWFFSRIL